MSNVNFMTDDEIRLLIIHVSRISRHFEHTAMNGSNSVDEMLAYVSLFGDCDEDLPTHGPIIRDTLRVEFERLANEEERDE